MRVLQVIPTLRISDGGPAVNALGLHQALLASGVEVIPAVFSGAAGADNVVEDLAPESFREGAGLLAWLQRLHVATRGADFVIIHGIYTASTVLAAVSCWINGTRYFLIPHGVLTPYQRMTSRHRKWLWDVLLGNLVQRRSAGLCVATEREARQCEAVSPVKAYVTGIGVGLPSVLTRRTDLGAVRRLLFLSRIAPKKRLDLFIDAVVELSRRGIPVEAVIAGSGPAPYVEAMRSRADTSGFASSFTWAGLVDGDGRTALMNDSDVLVLPTDDENFGIAIAEALAHALPVITTEEAGAAQFVAEGAAGAVLKEPTGADLADAVMSVCASPATWSGASSGAREVARTSLTWSSVAARWLRLSEEIGVGQRV